ncbi:MAG: hypothetical protein HKN37_09085 [Rhodothermales bacterium]|nr:hypothetical protein [Rhodothermales bacterium]
MRAILPAVRRHNTLLIPLLALTMSGLFISACDSTVAPESVVATAGDAAAAKMSARGSWNNWHVHDLAPPAVPYTDENGLRHEGYDIWPLIWPDYPSPASPVVYCIDGAEKALVGGDGGSKLASGTCRNELYIIQIKLNASDGPVPAESSGWTALPLGNLTLYYRLTPR